MSMLVMVGVEIKYIPARPETARRPPSPISLGRETFPLGGFVLLSNLVSTKECKQISYL